MMAGSRPEPRWQFVGRASVRVAWAEIHRHSPRATTLKGRVSRLWRTCQAASVVPETGESNG